MALRRSAHRWFLRDMPRAFVLLVGLVFAFSILIYFIDWEREVAAGIQTNSASKPTTASMLKIDRAKNDELYTGSIILVPMRGEQCWELALDNRTGRMWEKGYVDCYKVGSQDAAKNSIAARMRSIGDAFLHKID